MLKPWTCSFQANGHWYEMTEATYQKGKKAAGLNWTNAKIVDALEAAGHKFTVDQRNGFIWID